MKKLDYAFKGFTLTYQPNNTNHLILIVANDMAASIVYPSLTISTNISLKYSMNKEYLDLFVYINDADQFLELNYHVDERTIALAYAIDNSLITDLWVAYYQGDKMLSFGTAIQLSHR